MITLRFKINFISDESGYSCWVHVSGDDERADYATHAGYAFNATEAQDKAFGHASDLQRVLIFAGVKSKIIEGKHELRAGDRFYRTAIA